MRIVHLQHPYIPDLGYQENYLPFRQQDLGHDVHIVTTDVVPEKFLDGGVRSKRFKTGTTIHNGVSIHRHRSLTYDTEAATLPMGTIQRINNINPDVIHSHRLVSLLSIISPLNSLFQDSKLFFDLHIDNDNFHLDEIYKKVSFRVFRQIVLPGLLRLADGFIPVNPYAKKFLIDRLNIDELKVHLLPLGVDTDLFYSSQSERRTVRQQLGINNDTFTCITAGNLNESKRVLEIIESVSDLDDTHLLIIGKGPDEYMDQITGLINELDMADRVHLPGFVDHDKLSMFYNAADVGIWPGKLGVTILEAIGCGLPIIVDDSSATEFLISNDNGKTVSSSTPHEIEQQVREYYNSPDLRRRHQSNALELVESTLSWEAIASQSISIYK